MQFDNVTFDNIAIVPPIPPSAPSSISLLVVAGGGGGGRSAYGYPTGGGGGGGNASAGRGGSGVVLIRYADSSLAASSATGLAVGYPVVSGGYRVYKWNSSGSITF
jgi:hypothetical protein